MLVVGALTFVMSSIYLVRFFVLLDKNRLVRWSGHLKSIVVRAVTVFLILTFVIFDFQI